MKEEQTEKVKLPEKLTFENMEKIIDDIKSRLDNIKEVEITDVRDIDIYGFQFILSLRKAGIKISGFEKIKDFFDFELLLPSSSENKEEHQGEKK